MATITAAEIREYEASIRATGVSEAEIARSIYDKATEVGVDANQIDQALGLRSGTSSSYVNGEGLDVLTGTPAAPEIGGGFSDPGQFNLETAIPVGTTQATATISATPDAIETSTVEGAQIEAAQSATIATAQAATGEVTAASMAQAAIGNLPPEALVSSQMEELTASLEAGDEAPIWARGAVDAVEAQLAARGLTRSSIGQSALTNAIIQAALPIAQGNAAAIQSTFQQNLANEQQVNVVNAQANQQMGLANLQNEQNTALANLQVENQTNLTDLNNRQQALLSNQASTNAAAQFNASSENQTAQFMANLETQVNLRNADTISTTSQFNANQENAMGQFNANIDFNTNKFNAQNGTLISQSNLEWRREVNTAETAAENQENLVTLQNEYNISAAEVEMAWQELRDAASWAFTASQNDNQIQSALTQAALSSETQLTIAKLKSAQESYAAIGGAAFNVIGNMFSGDTAQGLLSGVGDNIAEWIFG